MSELKVQDKEELTLKKFKAEAGDKEGIKEADIRKKLKGLVFFIFYFLFFIFNIDI